MTFKANNAEGGTNTTAVTTANSGGASGDAWNTISLGAAPAGVISFDNSTTAHGGFCHLFTGAAARNTSMAWNFTEGTQFWGRTYINIPSNPSSVFGIVNHRLSAVNGARLQINTTGKLLIMDAGGTVRDTSTISLTTSAWLRLEWSVVFSATVGSISWSWYVGDSTTASDSRSSSSINTAASMDEISFGIFATPATAVTVRYDDLAASNVGAIGPWKSPRPMLAVPSQAVTRANQW